MKQLYRLAALFLALLLLCGCAAGNGYGKPERKEGQDEYLTDPVPEGKPQPVEPQDVTVSDTEYTCTISISCAKRRSASSTVTPFFTKRSSSSGTPSSVSATITCATDSLLLDPHEV